MKELSFNLFKNSELLGILIVSLIIICLIVFLFNYIFKLNISIKGFKNVPNGSKLNKFDYFAILIITLIYSTVSLWSLGSTKIPTTTWQPTIEDQTIILKVNDFDTNFDSVFAIYGEGDNNSNPSVLQIGSDNITLYGSNDLENYETITSLDGGSIYQYNIKHGDFNYKYIKIVCNDKNNTLSELAFRSTSSNRFLNISILEDAGHTSKYPASLLFDETEKIPLTPTYYDQGYFDEIYHPRNAWEIANGQLMYSSVHPLLGTSIIAASIKLFGLSPLSWRLPGAIFGIMMLPLFYMILKTVFKKTNLSIIGTALFSFDFMHLTTSRIGTLEPFSVFIILLMFYFMFKYYYLDFFDTPIKTQFKYLALCGISMGIGWSIKWTVLYSSIGLAILFFTSIFKAYKQNEEFKKLLKTIEDEHVLNKINSFNKNLMLTLLWCVLFFVIIPSLTYIISYSWCNVWRNDTFSIANVIKQNSYMFNYHKDLKATHPYQSNWYHWLLDLRPVWYYYGTTKEGYKSTIACFSNPIISWSGLLALIYTLYLTIKKKDEKGYMIMIGFLTAFLPWIGIGRCLFSYHFYPSTPFLIMAIVLSIDYLLETNKLTNKHTYYYLFICGFIFIMFLPVLTGFGTSAEYFNTFLRWIPSWYFGN